MHQSQFAAYLNSLPCPVPVLFECGDGHNAKMRLWQPGGKPLLEHFACQQGGKLADYSKFAEGEEKRKAQLERAVIKVPTGGRRVSSGRIVHCGEFGGFQNRHHAEQLGKGVDFIINPVHESKGLLTTGLENRMLKEKQHRFYIGSGTPYLHIGNQGSDADKSVRLFLKGKEIEGKEIEGSGNGADGTMKNGGAGYAIGVVNIADKVSQCSKAVTSYSFVNSTKPQGKNATGAGANTKKPVIKKNDKMKTSNKKG